MKIKSLKNIIFLAPVVLVMSAACNTVSPTPDTHTEEPTSMPQQNGFSDESAIPNDSGIEGVQTFPDKSEYHDHVDSLPEPEGTIPPAFGAHFSAWQNCGIYDQPIELGNALHSMGLVDLYA